MDLEQFIAENCAEHLLVRNDEVAEIEDVEEDDEIDMKRTKVTECTGTDICTGFSIKSCF